MLVAKVAITASASVERATEPDWGWCPLLVTRATGRGQWPSVSAWLLQLTCVATVIYQYRIKELEEFNPKHSIFCH